jgi:hypothetical protein
MRPRPLQLLMILLMFSAAFAASRIFIFNTRENNNTEIRKKHSTYGQTITQIPKPTLRLSDKWGVDPYPPDLKEYPVPLKTDDMGPAHDQYYLKKYVRTKVCAAPEAVASICHDLASIMEADWSGREQRLENIIRMSDYQNVVRDNKTRPIKELWAEWKRILLRAGDACK